MIYLGSRYETATVSMVTTAEGDVSPAVFRGASPLAPSDQEFSYTIKPGDRIDNLAYRFYGREDYYWVLADANPDIDLINLPPGGMMVVPSVVG